MPRIQLWHVTHEILSSHAQEGDYVMLPAWLSRTTQRFETVPCPKYECVMPHTRSQHFSFFTHLIRDVTCMWDMTHSYVWHDFFIRVTWLIYMCEKWMNYVCEKWMNKPCFTRRSERGPYLIYEYFISHVNAWCLKYKCVMSHIIAPCLTYECIMSYSGLKQCLVM